MAVALLAASTSATMAAPNVEVTKTPDADQVAAASPIGFTITVLSNGVLDAENVTLTDQLPTGTGIQWIEDPDVAACSITGNTLSCFWSVFPSVTSVSIHVKSNTTAQSCGVYNNTATVSWVYNGETTQASSNQATTTVTCAPGTPKLEVTKTADAAEVNAGSPIGFTITVKNTGTAAAENVTLTDQLPTGAGIAWTENPDQSACAISSGALSCSFGTLAAGATVSVHVSSPTTAQSCGVYNNQAQVQATGVSPVQSNQASTTVKCVPQTPSAQITPTGTTCQQFRDGQAGDLTDLLYGVKDGRINNVAPGIGFYFVKVTAPASSFTVRIDQSDTGTTPAFGVQSVQVYTATNCERYQNVAVNVSSGNQVVTVTVNGATTNQAFIIRLAFDPNLVVGSAEAGTVVYTYTSSVNGVAVPGSSDSVNLRRKS